jgi:integrase
MPFRESGGMVPGLDGDWVSRFMVDCRRRGLSPRSLESYEVKLNVLSSRYGLDLSSCGEDELVRVLDQLNRFSRKYFQDWTVFIRQVLRFLGRRKLVDVVKIPKCEDRAGKLKNKILSREEVEKLIKKAPTLQDRLLIHLLYETGARIGEVYTIRIKDVQFDQYGDILNLTGKSGTRRRRVFACVPDLRRQINDHPFKDRPDARLFHFGRRGSSEFHHKALYDHVERLGKIIGKKSIRTC